RAPKVSVKRCNANIGRQVRNACAATCKNQIKPFFRDRGRTLRNTTSDIDIGRWTQNNRIAGTHRSSRETTANSVIAVKLVLQDHQRTDIPPINSMDVQQSSHAQLKQFPSAIEILNLLRKVVSTHYSPASSLAAVLIRRSRCSRRIDDKVPHRVAGGEVVCGMEKK